MSVMCSSKMSHSRFSFVKSWMVQIHCCGLLTQVPVELLRRSGRFQPISCFVRTQIEHAHPFRTASGEQVQIDHELMHA